MVRLLVATFCREVHSYLAEPDRRHSVRDTVATAIREYRPAVVLAHSLGSVVAYETLWANPDLRVELLLTLGSPLAMPEVVYSRLDPAPIGGKGQRPPGVRRWINIADPGDFIAIPRGLPDYFDGIDADLATPIGVFTSTRSPATCPAPRPRPRWPPSSGGEHHPMNSRRSSSGRSSDDGNAPFYYPG